MKSSPDICCDTSVALSVLTHCLKQIISSPSNSSPAWRSSSCNIAFLPGHSWHLCSMQSLDKVLQTSFSRSSLYSSFGSRAASISFTFWCMVYTQTVCVPLPPAITHHLASAGPQLTEFREADSELKFLFEVYVDFMEICHQKMFLFMLTLWYAFNNCPHRDKILLARADSAHLIMLVILDHCIFRNVRQIFTPPFTWYSYNALGFSKCTGFLDSVAGHFKFLWGSRNSPCFWHHCQ